MVLSKKETKIKKLKKAKNKNFFAQNLPYKNLSYNIINYSW